MYAIIEAKTKRIVSQADDLKSAMLTVLEFEGEKNDVLGEFYAQEVSHTELQEYRARSAGKLTFYNTVKLDNRVQYAYLHLSADTQQKLIFENEQDAEVYALRNKLMFIGSV